MEAKMIDISEKDVRFSFSRTSGPGGQNVNKVNSKVTLFFSVEDSNLTDEQKSKVLAKSNRLNKEGEIWISSQIHRSQHQNRQECLALLQNHLEKLLAPVKKRKKKKVSQKEKEKRLQAKKRRAEKKKLRKKPKPCSSHRGAFIFS